MKVICSIYKSLRHQEMYLYVLKTDIMKRVPSDLLELFGKPEHVFDLVLTPERTLSVENVQTVLNNLKEQGYHLQLPPDNLDLVKIIEFK
ncbi:UNVERIFIED_CONTAM: hypothetical protein GTU68_002583 [Idotea baltica]|nr:hypothetical protein [Idotea baltica]